MGVPGLLKTLALGGVAGCMILGVRAQVASG